MNTLPGRPGYGFGRLLLVLVHLYSGRIHLAEAIVAILRQAITIAFTEAPIIGAARLRLEETFDQMHFPMAAIGLEPESQVFKSVVFRIRVLDLNRVVEQSEG